MAKAPAVQPSEWLLLALRESKGGLTPVQLQKALFLLSRRRSKAVGARFYKFEAYNYGPFCRQIYSDADAMTLFGQIEIDDSMGRSLRRYRLTPTGLQLTEQIAEKADKDGIVYLAEVVPWVQSVSFNELVRAVYQAYPEMRANSVFQDPQ